MSIPTSDTINPEGEEVASATNSIQPRIYINRLSPAADVNYWSRREITLFTNRQLRNPGNSSQYVTVNWRCTAYVYTTGARPDAPNFAASGGVMYVVLAHQGDINSTLVNHNQAVTLLIRSPRALPDRQLPIYGTATGQNWLMKIDYHQRMQMFKSGGNVVEPFEAEYVHEYELDKMKQSGQTFSDRLEIVFDPNRGSSWQTRIELNGLSVFRNTDPRQFPLPFTFEATARWNNATTRATVSPTIPLGF